MENNKVSYIGIIAVMFVVVLATSNLNAALAQNTTDETLNLNLTGSDLLSTSNSTGTGSGSNWTDSNSTSTPQ